MKYPKEMEASGRRISVLHIHQERMPYPQYKAVGTANMQIFTLKKNVLLRLGYVNGLRKLLSSYKNNQNKFK